MNTIKEYKVVIAVVLTILILVLFRSFNSNHFINDAKRWAGPSVSRSNIISPEQAEILSGDKLVVILDQKTSELNNVSKDVRNIPSDSILKKKYLNTISKHRGPVLLFSSDTGVSSRIWMILSQMGIKNIYILTNNTDNEVLKNKFRPDSLTRPEF